MCLYVRFIHLSFLFFFLQITASIFIPSGIQIKHLLVLASTHVLAQQETNLHVGLYMVVSVCVCVRACI